MTDVATLIGRINSQIADGLTAAGLPTTSLVAGLGDDGNGIRLEQDSTFGSAIRVTANNNSPAADQIGLLGATYDTATSTLLGRDTAKARVDGLFSDLIDLRDALNADDTFGIGLAGERLEATLTVLAERRGAVGGLAQRVDEALVQEQDIATLDEQVRSQLRDVDFTEAASRFTLLQTQLQAGLQATAAAGNRTLLDFLG
jgi:flagellin-like hook-associated protein FlgL